MSEAMSAEAAVAATWTRARACERPSCRASERTSASTSEAAPATLAPTDTCWHAAQIHLYPNLTQPLDFDAANEGVPKPAQTLDSVALTRECVEVSVLRNKSAREGKSGAERM